MDSSGYYTVVAVRKHKSTPNAHDRYAICSVPNGCFLNPGCIVFYGNPDSSNYEKGVCVSDTLFVDAATLDVLRTVTSTPYPIPEIKGKVFVEWVCTENTGQKKEECF